MTRLTTFTLMALTAVLTLSACSGEQTAPETISFDDWDSSLVATGESIVKARCTSCHTAEPTGLSIRQDAPPLRTVLSIYNAESLADDFREHIHVGHPDMPDFDFTVKETEAVLAYLKSIQAP